MFNIGTGAPFLYDYMNTMTSIVEPNTVHIENTGLNRYFERYLTQRAMSVFQWNMPDNWAENYALYCLYLWGCFAVIETDKFGVIPQGCSLRGYNVFYQPTNAVIVNPLLKGIKEPEIDKQCVLFRLQPDYGGIWDIISYYANLMSLISEAIGINVVNTKLAYVFGAENQAQAESFKKMYDEIQTGNPAVFVDKNLLDDNGKPRWFTFVNNINEMYIADDLLANLRMVTNMFDSEIGIPNANTEKKERLITQEVDANNFETISKCTIWLKHLKESCQKTKDLFGVDVSVDWNPELKREIENKDTGGLERWFDSGREGIRA